MNPPNYDLWPSNYLAEMAMAMAMTVPLNRMMNRALGYAQYGSAIPPALWHVLVDGRDTVMTFEELCRAAAQGNVNPATYLWRQGMTEWQRADQVPEISALLGATPPPIPGCQPPQQP